VSGYCTCGAKLPEDARFCHKCGKPQRDEPLLVEEAPPPPPQPTLPPAPQFPPIGFRNRPAVSAALVSGVAGFLLSILSGQVLPAASSIGLVAAGFLAVYLYRRRTGQRLSVIHGAHLGWIAGIFGFAITIAVLSLVVVALSDPAVLDAMREQLRGAAGTRQADINQVIEMMHNPVLMLMGVAVTFLLFTVLPAFGGALGAKLLDRD
jgi:zinc-ribbon domain